MSSPEIQHNSPSGDNKPETHRVLIVDDEPAICFAYRKLLENELFSFDICESVEAAIALLNKNRYLAVISDVRFAGSDNKDGVYFVSVLRKVQPQAKVILVTGYGSDELKKSAHELGVSHYFPDYGSSEQKRILAWFTQPDLKVTHLCDAYLWVEYPFGHPHHSRNADKRKYWLNQFGFSRGHVAKGIAVVWLPAGLILPSGDV